jgi:hypothetical protein
MSRSSIVRLLLDLLRRYLRSSSSSGRRPSELPPRQPLRDPRRAASPRDPRRGEVDTAEGKVRIDYAPHGDGDADPGEIVWAWVPYEDDPSQGKDRPLLVIGHLDADVAALAMTTRAHDDRHHHPIGSGSWDSSGRPSWVKLDRVIRLDPDGIRREGAVIDRGRFDAAVAAWQAY